MTTETNTDEKVSALLKQHGISYSAQHVRATTKKDTPDAKPWECDQWSIKFALGNTAESFDYFTGTGHRKPTLPMPTPPYRKGTIAYEGWARLSLRPVAPSAASVLHSILLDSEAAKVSFNEWCSEYGYNNDSIKAEQTYRACQENADRLVRIMPRDVRAEMAKLLEDY